VSVGVFVAVCARPVPAKAKPTTMQPTSLILILDFAMEPPPVSVIALFLT
jgi:hypothetical protein